MSIHDISTFKGRVKLLVLTEEGENILKKMGYEIGKKREGSTEHEYWKYRIAEFLRSRGYQVEIEKPIGEGKAVDMVAIKDVERIAIEIETGKSDVVENIVKSLDEGFSRIIVVPLNLKAKSEISMKMKELPSCELPKVEILTLKGLFKD